MRVRASRPSFWVGPDLRHLERPELAASRLPDQRPGRRGAGRPGPRSTSRWLPTSRRTVPGHHRRPDLLPGPVGAEPGVPRRQRRAGLHPVALPLPDRGRHHRLVHLDGAGHHLHRGVGRQHGRRPAAAGGHRRRSRRTAPRARPSTTAQHDPLPAAPPSLPPGGRAGPSHHRRHRDPRRSRPPHLRQGRGHRGVDGRPHPLHDRHPAAGPGGRRGRPASSSGPALGYCEQISTATVVMLRSLGIPAREAVGYVPGSYNPITDLYDVQAKDAHAWVQVWFPGYGWQNFDPTADVPLANPSPGFGAGRHRRARPAPTSRGFPSAWSVAVVAAVVEVRRRRRRRPPTWAHQVAADLARGGARAGPARRRRRDAVRLRPAAGRGGLAPTGPA